MKLLHAAQRQNENVFKQAEIAFRCLEIDFIIPSYQSGCQTKNHPIGVFIVA
jgi:hypothetical protein